MRVILFIILSFVPFFGYAQLSQDSLKKVLADQYLHNLCTEYMKLGRAPSLVFEKMQELFQGSFNNTKIYLVTFRDADVHKADHDPGFYPVLYAVDIFTGQPLSFNDSKAFCDFVNTTNKPVANLDKAYLYICLYLEIFQGSFVMADPHWYHSEIRQNSQFANDTGILRVFFNFPRQVEPVCMVLLSQKSPVDSLVVHSRDYHFCHDYLSSSLNKITIFSKEIKCAPTRSVEYQCQFSFDETNNLAGIVTDTVTNTLR